MTDHTKETKDRLERDNQDQDREQRGATMTQQRQGTQDDRDLNVDEKNIDEQEENRTGNRNPADRTS